MTISLRLLDGSVAMVEQARAPFERVISAAFELAPYTQDMDLESVRPALGNASGGSPPINETAYLLFEELAGVVAGYQASPIMARDPI